MEVANRAIVAANIRNFPIFLGLKALLIFFLISFFLDGGFFTFFFLLVIYFIFPKSLLPNFIILSFSNFKV